MLVTLGISIHFISDFVPDPDSESGSEFTDQNASGFDRIRIHITRNTHQVVNKPGAVSAGRVDGSLLGPDQEVVYVVLRERQAGRRHSLRPGGTNGRFILAILAKNALFKNRMQYNFTGNYQKMHFLIHPKTLFKKKYQNK